jgi:predicted metal-dependent hydrolase
MSTRVPEPLRRFAGLFAHGAFWESHEVLEVPWREGRSGFYKGLILLASAWVHVQRGNPRGIAAQLRKAVQALEPYRPAYLGVDVELLLAHAEAAQRTVAAHPDAAWHRWEGLLPPPPLELRSARVRGDEPELAARGDRPA